MGMSLPEIAFLKGYQSAGDIYYLPSLPALAGGRDEQVQARAAGAAPVRDQATADAQVKAAIGGHARLASFSLTLREPWVACNHSIAPLTGYDRWVFG